MEDEADEAVPPPPSFLCPITAEIMAALQSPDYIGNCAHFAAILHTLSQAAEIQSRYIGISGDGWIDGEDLQCLMEGEEDNGFDDYCGIAYVITTIAGFPNYAFSVVKGSCAELRARMSLSRTWYVPLTSCYYSLVHEDE